MPAISCTAADLAAASKCLCGIASPADRQRVMIYLLQHIAGLDSLTPAELVARAKCLCGIPENRLKAVEVALLCAATGGVPPCPPCPPGGNCTYQNMQVAWTPTGLKFGEEIGFFSSAGLAGITAIAFDGATNAEQLFINNATDLVSFSLLNMTGFNTLQLGTNVKLTTILLPLVANCDSITIQNNPLVTSLDFASLVSTNSLGDFNDFTISGNIALTSINLPLYVPDNTLGINFSGNALNVASVNQLLARCVANAAFVSGAINLTGGTNSPPTSKAPGSDYAILIARGVTVNTN